MANLKDVSRAAKVSVSTASIILSGGAQSSQIPLATQQAIRKAAMMLKYLPQASAKQLRANCTGTVALLVNTDGDRSSLTGELVRGINDELLLRDCGFHFVCLTDDVINKQAFLPRFLRQEEVDGVLVDYHVAIPKRFTKLIKHYEIPAIYLNTKQDLDAVYFDHYGSTRRVIRQLIEFGHREILMINFTGNYDHYSLRDSYQGYSDQMVEQDLRPVLIEERIPHRDRINAAIDILNGNRNGVSVPTAVLTMSLTSAFPFIQAMDRLGYKIPDKLSLVTLDGTSNQAALVQPELTRICIPFAEEGRVAVKMLLEKIADKSQAMKSRVLPCPLLNTGNTIGYV